MNLINQVTSDASQQQQFILADGSSFIFQLQFIPMQYGWFITSLVYKNFQLNGLRVTNSPNMLHQFLNQIPFGLACYSTNQREPSQQQDFSSGNSNLYVLTQLECQQYLELLTGAG